MERASRAECRSSLERSVPARREARRASEPWGSSGQLSLDPTVRQRYPTRRPRSAFLRETQRGPLRALSLAMQRQPNDVPIVAEAFDAIHQPAHQKKSAALFPGEILGRGAVLLTLVEIEARTLVYDLENQVF